MKNVTLGGNRLGSGKKQKVELHGFERSTHDLGFVWRNTQAPGTLVPFMCQLALPGDTFDINLGADVKTHPTLGPLFASFKLQLDIFECPIRLYHGWLHNNKLGVGLNMSSVKLPDITINCNPLLWNQDSLEDSGYPRLSQQQINPSSIYSYLGIKGVGNGERGKCERTFNAIPFYAYWDIYKNYYANKQEEIGMVIHQQLDRPVLTPVQVSGDVTYWGKPWNIYENIAQGDTITVTIDVKELTNLVNIVMLSNSNTWISQGVARALWTSETDMGGYWRIVFTTSIIDGTANKLMGFQIDNVSMNSQISEIAVASFPLVNIDTLRDNILKWDRSYPFPINAAPQVPYQLPLEEYPSEYNIGTLSMISCQEGLALKTYQSDIFNNWLNTEWIDGTGGINDITKISTAGGSFDLNTFNLAQKVYDMLNRIAVSGGSYEDWLDAVYDHTPFRRCESPIYHGGLSKEIIFQEVVSTAKTSDPLGQLAGRGGMAPKHKGGQVNIKVSEPSYIIGIVSITPRIDYSQGNDFFVNHRTLDDIHKPSLDEIGFQDLVTDKLSFWDTRIDEYKNVIFKSAGKQPAWIDYMTNYNRLHGNFAIEDNEMFMTLARRYSPDASLQEIKDLTTYIDPTKFNYAFAQTDLSAMNFWVQIGCDIIARRKMSAKVMPNL